MFFKIKSTYPFIFGIFYVGNPSFAGNLSLYSFSEEGAVTGMPNITSGDDNVAIGDEALLANTSGSNNTAVGDEALKSNTSGFQNTAIGKNSLYSNTYGQQNIAVGFEALKNNTGGNYIRPLEPKQIAQIHPGH